MTEVIVEGFKCEKCGQHFSDKGSCQHHETECVVLKEGMEFMLGGRRLTIHHLDPAIKFDDRPMVMARTKGRGYIDNKPFSWSAACKGLVTDHDKILA